MLGPWRMRWRLRTSRRRTTASGRGRCTATRFVCSSWSTRCSISRASRRAGSRLVRADGLRRADRVSWRACSARRSSAPASRCGSTARARGAGLRRSRHVGKDRPQSPLQRPQVHLRRGDRGLACGATAPTSCWRCRTPGPAFRRRAAPRLRSLSPDQGGARADPRRDRNRAGAGRRSSSKLHGGRSRVESEVGRGTTFRVRLPRGPRAPAGRPDRARPRHLALDVDRRAPTSRRRCAGSAATSVARRRRRGGGLVAANAGPRARASSWPTTTPTCATTCPPPARALDCRGGARRRRGAGGDLSGSRPTSFSAT